MLLQVRRTFTDCERDRDDGPGNNERIDESGLRKGELRKLRALRKSLGTEIADRAFAEWMSLRSTGSNEEDTNADTIVDALWPLVQEGKLTIPRGGYLLRRGRGRIIVEAARS